MSDYEVTIKTADAVRCENNVLIISSGFRTNNILPISEINLVSEVISAGSSIGKYYCIFINYSNGAKIKIKTEKETIDNENVIDVLLYPIHSLIQESMLNYHRSKSYVFNKPKDFNHD